MIQAEPIYGSSPSKPIEIKIVYDDNFLYVSAYLFDDPSNIKRQSASYDDWYEGFENNSDYFVVEIDSNHDHHQSNCFAVNSAGVKADYIMYNDGVVDDDWNAASWDAKDAHHHKRQPGKEHDNSSGSYKEQKLRSLATWPRSETNLPEKRDLKRSNQSRWCQ